MADSLGVHIVEVRAGNSQRPVLELQPGVAVQPMSIGRVGMWPVDAPDVLDVHAFLYFDGRSLFVQSADANNPARGNGQPIGVTWQQIEIPCTIELGRARLVYRTLDEDADSDEDKTVAQAIRIPETGSQGQFRPNAGAFSNRNERKGPDSDATRLQPMNLSREPDPTVVSPLEAGTPMTGVPKARPAAGMPAGMQAGAGSYGDGPLSSNTSPGAPPAPPMNTGYQAFGSVQVAVPPPPPAPNPMMQTLQAPLQSPLAQMQQPMYGMPPNMMMPPQQMPQQMQMLPHQGPTAETVGRIQPPPGEASPAKAALEKAVAEWKAMPTLRKVIVGTFPGVALLVYFMLFDEPAPIPQPQARPKPSASASASTVTPPIPTPTPPNSQTFVPVPVPFTSASSSGAQIPPITPPNKGQRTLERQAIDYVAQGQIAKAIEVYDQLATQHPDQPVYREAARLLRLRMNGTN